MMAETIVVWKLICVLSILGLLEASQKWRRRQPHLVDPRVMSGGGLQVRELAQKLAQAKRR